MPTAKRQKRLPNSALPDDYFSRPRIDASKLAALIDSIDNIAMVEHRVPEAERKLEEVL